MRRLKEMEDRMDARIEATIEARVQQILLSKGQEYHKALLLLPLGHSLGVAAAADRPRSTKKMRMCLIRWTASLNPSMSSCIFVRNEQRTRWHSARPGLRETGPLMIAQFHRGTLVSQLIEYLIRSIIRYTLSTPQRNMPKLSHNKGSQVA